MQARVAVGLGAVQHLLREAGHRRLPHDAQRRRQRAGAFGIHQHARVAQVGNACLHARELPAGVPAHLRPSVLHLHAVVVEDQLARQVLQRRPGHLPGGLQAGRHVGQRDAVHLPGKAEFAARRCLRTGDVAQIALHAHRHVARLALDHRLAHVAARRFGNAQRQVTVHARAVGAAEAARQVQHARKARRPLLAGHGLPFRLEGARGIGVAQLQLVHVQLDLPALHAPASAGGQLGQRDARLVEHARKAEGAVADGQRRVAAGRRGLELQRSPFDARNAFHRLAIGPGRRGARTHGHGAGPGLHAPVARRLQRAAPARLDALDQALHRVRLQALVHRWRQRQALRDLGQRRQVQAVALQLAAVGVAVAQLHVAAGPGQAVGIDEVQVARVHLHALAHVAPAQPAGQRGEGQRLQRRAKGGRHAAQGHVGRGGRQHALLHVGPQAQRAMAPLKINAPVGFQVGVLPQLRHVDAPEIGEGMALPVAPEARMAREHRLAELPDQREALAPGGVGRGVQSQLVAAVAVAHHELHVVQRHRRRAAALVHPAHAAAAHDEFGLREEPVGGRRVTRCVARQVDAAHQQAAVGGAAQLQVGLVDDQLLQRAAAQR